MDVIRNTESSNIRDLTTQRATTDVIYKRNKRRLFM